MNHFKGKQFKKRRHYCRCWLLPAVYNLSYREVQDWYYMIVE